MVKTNKTNDLDSLHDSVMPRDHGNAGSVKRPNNALIQRQGGNQVSIGQYNERLILSLLRTGGGLTKAELARRTSLTAQTITVIVNRLESRGLVVAGDKQRGKVGQPRTPYHLNPHGVVTMGIKIGRRQLDYLAMGFDGSILARDTFRLGHPLPKDIMGKLAETLPNFVANLPDNLRQNLIGFGVAMPNDLSSWETIIGVESGALAGWDDIDICAEIEAITGYPAQVMNDVTAACLAELNFGIGNQYRDFLYMYVGSLIGGGLVLDHQLQIGRRGYAAALGPMALSVSQGSKADAAPDMLLDKASLITLENGFAEAGLDRGITCRDNAFTGAYQDIFQSWLDEASNTIAFSIINSAAILELDAVIIDAAIAPENLSHLIEAIKTKLTEYRKEGLHMPDILEGTRGYDARVLGGAFLPISTHYAADNSRLVKEQL